MQVQALQEAVAHDKGSASPHRPMTSEAAPVHLGKGSADEEDLAELPTLSEEERRAKLDAAMETQHRLLRTRLGLPESPQPSPTPKGRPAMFGVIKVGAP